MSDSRDNPLYNIFIKNPKGALTEEIDSIKNIPFFFNFLSNEKVKEDSKEKVIRDLTNIIHTNRYVAEFFSSNNNKSIYIYLFDLYTNKNTSQKLKDAIISFLDELRINIQTGKDIYEYLFQKISQIYRGESPPSSNNLYQYLKLLHAILADTEAAQSPKNYFACSGHCKFYVDLNKKAIEVGYSFTINLNFKISNYYVDEKNQDKNRISNLVKIYFSNKKSLSVDLQYPFLLIVKEIRKEFIKTFPLDDWINLIITIVNGNNGLYFYFYVNGENHVNPYKIEKLSLKCDDTIKYIDFFNNFYGEVSSIFMFSQTEQGPPGINNSGFLSQFKNFKEGLWKKTKIDSFFKILPNYESLSQDLSKSKTVYIKSPQIKTNEKKRTLWDNLVFIFTPINYLDTRPNYVEDGFGQYQLQFSGNIRNHRNQNYQKKLMLVSGFNNFYPIAEMFLIYPEILTEQNFEIFLKIIGSILNFRKQNLRGVKQNKLFKILSMFMEKYPNKVFTEKILNALDSLGKTLFINNLETLCSNYFNYILLNEKILSKYNENLQIKFWNKLFLFCQSDITQIETFLNINRLCLILRFYDKNKYKEMCCKEHLNMIKEDYVGSKKVMNPTMMKKLSYLKNIMDLIISSQEPSNAVALFKLLTLDLSPCLIKFILNIFINAFTKNSKDDVAKEMWKDKFVEQLMQSKYEVIIINTFIHTLPDVRIELLKFVYEVHLRKTSSFKVFEKMIKTCLLPMKMFYSRKVIKKQLPKKIKSKPKKIKIKKKVPKKTEIKIEEPKKVETKKEEPKKEEPKKIEPKSEDTKQKEEKKVDKLEPKKEEPKKVKEEPKKEEIIIKETKKEEVKKEEPKKVEIKKEVVKKEEPKKEEPKKLETKKEEPQKIEIKKEEPKKEEPKKFEPKKEEPKKIEPKKEEPKKTGPKKEELMKNQSTIIKEQEKKEEVKKPELRPTKTFQVKDNTKKEEFTKPIKTGTNKQNFLALLSKFDKPKNNPSQEPKKAHPKQIQRDNPFFKTLNTPSTNKINEQLKKEKPKIEKPKDEKPKIEKPKDEKPKIEKPKEEKPKPKEVEIKPVEKPPVKNEEKKNIEPPTKIEEKKKETPVKVEEKKEIPVKVEEKKQLKIDEKKIETPKVEDKQPEKVEEKKIIKEEIKTPQSDNNIKKEEKEDKDKEILKSPESKITSSSDNKEKEKEKIKPITTPSKKPESPKKPMPINENKKIIPKYEEQKEEEEEEEEVEVEVEEEEKDEKENECDYVMEEVGEEEIIIKDSEFNKYIDKLYSVFILWSLSIDVNCPFNAISLDHCVIKNVNTIEILFILNEQLKSNKKIIIHFLNSLDKLTTNSENCYQLFFDKKVFSSFLDITFENYRLKGKDEETCYSLGKSILTNSFINSFPFCEKQKNQNPGKDLETIFIWGNKVLENDINKKEMLFDFIFELLYEFLTQFKIKYEPKIQLESSYNVENNYYYKSYLYFMVVMYNFSFRYNLDKEMHKKGIKYLYSTSPRMNIPQALVESMRINKAMDKNKIAMSWIDFPLLSDVLNRIKPIWAKKNVYKNKIGAIESNKKNKSDKYQYIIDNIIINKEIKNYYQKELVFLCFEDKKGGYEYICPLIRIVPLTLMCIISKLKNIDEDKDFKYWLKEFKNFLRFVIIASSNLTKINQNELYNNIEDKCLEVIAAGLCFLNNLLFSNSICKEKIEKSLDSLLLLCFKLVKYQYNYKLKHSKIFAFASKPARNDLQDCAINRLFYDYVKDKTGNPLMSLNKLESLPLESNNFASAINNLMIKQDFVTAFWENEALKSKLNTTIYSLTSYYNLVNYRYDLIQFLQDNLDESYKKTILDLLPQYENELAKYSNNSLEKNIKNKNRYKVFKKNAFSWRGYWSCRDNFFKNIEEFKFKLINHYTKTFMKPVLVPIIDISYYLPEFSGFNPKNLFKNGNDKSIFKLNLDIDKVLKSYETTTQDISSSISSKEKEENKENYLLTIYKKSNPVLYEKLLNIANNLEFGKEEEFAYVEREEKTSKKKKDEVKKTRKYFLSCLVKTSHHIKGVCFIDDKKLNFKVFLNQRTGSAMSGVEVGFTNKDDDYDQERKTCFGSFFVCHPKDKDLYKIAINYNDIKWIFKRKYYYTNSALEVYTTTNKTFYFNFKYEKDRNTVLDEILKKLDEPIPIVDDLKESNVENIVGYENGLIQKKKSDKIKKSIKLSKKIKKWKNWEMTNFELLMWLNIFGNRSYNDISQYPVFPWILSNYEDPLQVEQKIVIENKRTLSMPIIDPGEVLNATYTLSTGALNNMNDETEQYVIDYQYRDMNLPMGMLEISDESIKRKEEFDLNYETLLEVGDENNKPYVFGSNYSNPIYVCNYLMRLFPFTHISIELQGQGFDKPDRLFLSVKNSFFNSTSQKGDVRELIPEFFFLPEMFRNINKLNMGKLENGEEVNDVATPCHNNPYDFIMTMKSCLENNTISYSIQNWIDLIFGYKAKGKDAELARNIFKEAAYQENIDINKIEDKDIKESKLREVEFGLVPNQLMIKECNKRDRKELIKKGKEITDPECDLQIYNCKFKNETDKLNANLDNLPVIKFALFGPEKLTVLLGGTAVVEKKISYSIFDKTYYDEPTNLVFINNYSNKMSDFYNPKKPNSKAVQFAHKGKTLILGGFYDGKVLIIPLDQKYAPIQAVPFTDKLPILAVAVDQEDEFAFFGNAIGNIRIMKIDKDPGQWKYYQLLIDHLSAISYIDCSSELNLWVSASIDGYINLYTLPLSKLLRSIKVPTANCDYVFLSASPLPSIIAIGEDNKVSEIFVYSINGKLLIRQKEESLITSPIIIRDLNSNEYLAYILNETVVVRSIPTLFRQTSTDEISGIYSIIPSEDLKIMYGINKFGNQIHLIKDQKA